MNAVARIVTAAAAAALVSCVAIRPAFDNEEMLIKASALTKLAAAVESAVRYKDAPANLSEDELLNFATAHDPELLTPFRGFKVRARRDGMASAVLICTQDEKMALIEDAGCTARSDAHHWERRPPFSCDFQLALKTVCGLR